MKILYQIDTGYACAGIVTENKIVIEAAPIFKWMISKHTSEIEQWNKIKSVTKVNEEK